MIRCFRGALIVVIAVVAGAVAPSFAGATTETFNFNGAVQTWLVPPGVTSAAFDLYGAAGGNAAGDPDQGVPGLGGRATATLAVTPGESIQIRVGGQGGEQGGFNGGGTPNPGSEGGGGGATDVRKGGTTLADRVLIAGGGGGSGNCRSGSDSSTSNGGAGGGLVGTDAATSVPVSNCSSPGNSGKGGTQSAGGGAGPSAGAGALGLGGSAAAGHTATGAGGGGYYGGGGGAASQGGGGGSGFGPDGTIFETGVRSGAGVATVTYTQRLDLTVATVGSGTGRVTSTPAGIDCRSGSPANCKATYDGGTQVTLSASAGGGSTFAGWSGAGCAGNTSCTVTLNDAKSVEARFTADAIPPSCSVPTVSGTSYKPGKKLSGPVAPGVRARIAVSQSSEVQITPTLVYKVNGKRRKTTLAERTLGDPGSRNLRIVLPAPLRSRLKLGDRVGLNLTIRATPDSPAGCAAGVTSLQIRTKVVNVLTAPQIRTG